MAGPLRPRRPKATAQASRPSINRHARRRVKYAEPASDPEQDDSEDEYEPEEEPSPPRHTRSTAPLPPEPVPRRKRKRKLLRGKESGSSKKPRRTGAFNFRRTMKEEIQKSSKTRIEGIQSTGRTMPWSTLPLEILELIFYYASRPLLNENFAPSESVQWLLSMSRLCRGFAEPALTVLYTSPPLSPASRTRELIKALEAQHGGSYINYRAKIKRLELEALDVLGHKPGSSDHFDFGGLFLQTSQLRGIDFHLLSDNPKYFHSLAGKRKGHVTYPFGLVEKLRAGGIKVQDWTWNSHLHNQETWPLALKDIHMAPEFQTLQSLKLVNYDEGSWKGSSGLYYNASDLLPPALSVLPKLRHLTFHRCDVLEFMGLEDLPGGLHTLELNNCSVESPHLDKFLQSKGHTLRTLVLDHNQHLNLSWMNALAVCCPNLERLQMDLIYYSPFQVVSNIEPQYDALLDNLDRPSWPRSLRSIELHHLRKWNMTVADSFFRSLVDAAPDLPDLRTIRIKASINESGWRERKQFKDKWVETLNQVFLRNAKPPKPYLKSMATYKEWKKQQELAARVQVATKVKLPSRPIKHTPSRPYKEDSSSDSDAPLVDVKRRRRSARCRPTTGAQSQSSLNTSTPPTTPPRQCRTPRKYYYNDDSSTSDDEEEDEEEEEVQAAPSVQKDSQATHPPPTTTDASQPPKAPFRQGKCDIVDLKIDSQRPTEEQLNEGDFLDEEISGDEDWNGDDDFDADDDHAW